jgi:FkbM family methyltransferase
MAKPRAIGEQVVDAMRLRGIDLIIDVGANIGQYASRLRRDGYKGKIRSFEPLPAIHAELVKAASGDQHWVVEEPVALGRCDGQIEIERSAESDMSSILPQNDLHKAISPTSAIMERLRVPMRRLDSVLPDADLEGHRTLVKLDVQGFEHDVMEGMGRLWPLIDGLQIEMSLVPIYDGEVSWRETIDMVERRGFVLAMLLPGYYERKLGRQLQVDGLFFRPEKR